MLDNSKASSDDFGYWSLPVQALLYVGWRLVLECYLIYGVLPMSGGAASPLNRPTFFF